MFIRLMCSIVFFAAPALAQTWIADARGCRVWNGAPQPNESITWSGGCSADKLAEGRGVLQWFDAGRPGDRYEGDYRGGKENGRGVFVRTNGERFEGEWKDGLMTGRGVHVRANGNRYEGEWREGMMHGRGVFTWKDGDRYEGQWSYGKANGQGTMKMGSRTFTGPWENGCFRGGEEVNLLTTRRSCGWN